MTDEKKVVNKEESAKKDRRSVLKSVAAGSAVVTGSALSDQWTKPLSRSVILPAHATSTPSDTSAGDYHEDNFYIENSSGSTDYSPAGPGDYLELGDPEDGQAQDEDI